MAEVIEQILSLFPPKARSSSPGWRSFNAVCCHNRGHKADTRKRAGILLKQGVVYNCFNCGYSTGWQPGKTISLKFKTLLSWLGATDQQIAEIQLSALRAPANDQMQQDNFTEIFQTRELPPGTKIINQWLDETLTFQDEESLGLVVEYLIKRDCDPLSEMFAWSPDPGYRDRVILPFRYNNAVVGSTARRIKNLPPKYLSNQPSNFVYNVDNQNRHRKYVFVVEGPFDAIAVDGVAVLTNEISESQARLINSMDRTVIVIPDQDKAGVTMIDQAKELGWSVAFPTWGDSVKDCAEAVQKYGRLFVIVDAIKTAQQGNIKIEMAKRAHIKKLEKNNG
jgi:hypothetical protein